MLKKCIADGSAFRKFREFIEAQGGDVAFIDDTERFEKAKYSRVVKAESDGYIETINAERIGRVSVILGAGRETKDAPIDPSAGIHNYCKVGDFFKKGDTLAVLYADKEELLENAEQYYRAAYTVSEKPVKPLTTIYGFVDETGFHRF